MVVTFFGHADFQGEAKFKNKIENILEEFSFQQIDFYLGGYGNFDSFALRVCQEYKRKYPSTKLIYITPYLGSFLDKRKDYLEKIYDEILYPPIENVLLKFSISKRNRWIVEKADLLIVYVERNYGGAYKACKYAWKNKKKVVNLYKTV